MPFLDREEEEDYPFPSHKRDQPNDVNPVVPSPHFSVPLSSFVVRVNQKGRKSSGTKRRINERPSENRRRKIALPIQILDFSFP